MIKLEVAAKGLKADDRLNAYLQRKVGKLDKYLPRKKRQGVHAHVVLMDEEGKSNNRFTCEVRINLPHDQVMVKESTINIYAAIDIAEAKLKTQLLKYKGKLVDYHQAEQRRLWQRLSPFKRRSK